MANKKTVDIGLRYDIGTMQSSFNAVESKMRTQAKSLQRFGNKLALSISAPVIAGFGLAMKEFAEFEFNMAKVQAVSGATEKEFQGLKAQAEELGRTTKFTAQQVADLELQYSKLGFSASEIEKVTKATLDLALITDEDLGRSAEVAGSTLRGFNLDASEMGRVVDVMAASFTSSALDLEKFQVSISKIAPIAYATGRSIEEVTAAESVLADTGIEASIIGTSLRKIYGDLAKEGLSYADAMEQIRNATDPVVKATELFDIRAAAAAVTLAFQEDKFKRLLDTYNNAEGTTEKLSGTINDTLLIDLKELQSAVQNVAIKFGEVLAPSVRGATDLLTSLAQKVSGLSSPFKLWIASIAGVAASIPALLHMLASLSLATLRYGDVMKRTIRIAGGLFVAISALVTVIQLNEAWTKKARAASDISNKVSEETNKIVESQRKLIDRVNNLKIDGTAATKAQIKIDQLELKELIAKNKEKIKEIFLEKQLLQAKLIKMQADRKEFGSTPSAGAFSSSAAAGRSAKGAADAIESLKASIDNYNASIKEFKTSNIESEESLKNLEARIKIFEASLGSGSGAGNGSSLSDEMFSVDPFQEFINKYATDAYNSLFPKGTGELDNGISRALNKWADNFSNQFKLDIPLDIDMKPVWDKIKESGERLQEFTRDVERMTESAIFNISSMLGELLGRMFSDKEFGGKEFGRGILEMVGGFLQQLGALFIAWGVNYELFEKSIFSGNGPLAIAAGAALVAIGGAIKGAMSNGLEGSGSYSSPSYGSSGSNYDYGNFESEVVIQGREMIIVQRREGRFRR